MNAKQKAYLQRVQNATMCADATSELTPRALDSLASTLERMPADVFRELLEKGYLVAERRGFRFSPKAEAYRAHRGPTASNTPTSKF